MVSEDPYVATALGFLNRRRPFRPFLGHRVYRDPPPSKSFLSSLVGEPEGRVGYMGILPLANLSFQV